jgi:hypothetical protein
MCLECSELTREIRNLQDGGGRRIVVIVIPRCFGNGTERRLVATTTSTSRSTAAATRLFHVFLEPLQLFLRFLQLVGQDGGNVLLSRHGLLRTGAAGL